MTDRNLRRPRQFLTPADMAFLLGVSVLLGSLFFANLYLARTLKGGEWLFLRWSAARAYVFEHIDPYGSTIAQRVQHLAYGREAYLNDYPYVPNDPFYFVLLFVPLALISDFSIVHAVWMLLSQAALIAIVGLSIRLSEWQPPVWLWVFLIGFALLGSFSVMSFLSGSTAIFMTLFALLVLTAVETNADEVVGVLMFLISYQWEVSALFFLFILVFIVANRRWRILAGFGMSLTILFIVSLLLNSNWLVPYARAVLLDWTRRADYTFATTLSYLFPAIPISLNRWIALAVGALVLLETVRAVFEHSRHVAWAAFLALGLNPMMGFAIFPVNHIVMLPSMIMIVALVWERWKQPRAWISLALLIAVFVSSYALYFQVVAAPARLYSDLLKILPPVVITLGLYWMRWWAIRPPRLWADQIGVRK